MKNDFDYREYWIQRHKAGKDDIKAVGIKSYSKEANQVFYTIAKEQYAKLIEEHNISLSGKSVLDAGAGSGEYTEFLLSHNAKVDAVDISPDALAKIKLRFPQVHTIVSTLEDLNTHKQYYFVHCFDVLYHITDDQAWRSAIKNLASASREYIAIHDKFAKRKPLLTSPHVKVRPREEVFRELDKAGFSPVGSVPTTIVKRLATYKLTGLFPKAYARFDRYLLRKRYARNFGASNIVLFRRKIGAR